MIKKILTIVPLIIITKLSVLGQDTTVQYIYQNAFIQIQNILQQNDPNGFKKAVTQSNDNIFLILHQVIQPCYFMYKSLGA
jgi:hypothetical protein